jgi:hypothetical protein
MSVGIVLAGAVEAIPLRIVGSSVAIMGSVSLVATDEILTEIWCGSPIEEKAEVL